jgi:HEAT repeat protein
VSLLVVFVVGGMVLALFPLVSPSTPARLDAAEEEARGRALQRRDGEFPDAGAPPPIVDAAVDVVAVAASRAQAVLTALLASASVEARIAAASALARTGDASVLPVLTDLLRVEPSEITQLSIAYALARAGDDGGKRHLVRALRSPRRDVRADASQLLAQLGDPAGHTTLLSLLELSGHRLGAADALARTRDPRALKVLEAVRADAAASTHDRARAIIALGRAQQQEVVPELRKLLADPRFNAGAARALAELGHDSATAVLVQQLAVPSLRVGAAVALRRLGGSGPPASHLAGLALELDATRELDRALAAEAILILTGPKAWAERD